MLVLALSHGFRLLVFIDHKKWQFAAVAPREGGAHVIAVDQQSWREGLKIRGEMNGVCRFPDADKGFFLVFVYLILNHQIISISPPRHNALLIVQA